MKKLVVLLLAMVSVLAALRVAGYRLAPQLRFPADIGIADPQQEKRFEACVEARDYELHQRTFDTIDNPDVQREVLAAGMQRSREECRERFPEITTTIERPFRLRLVEPRS